MRNFALPGMVHWVECRLVDWKATGWIPSQGTSLGCRPGSQLGSCRMQSIQASLSHRCFSPSFSPSLSLSLKNINNQTNKKSCWGTWELLVFLWETQGSGGVSSQELCSSHAGETYIIWTITLLHFLIAQFLIIQVNPFLFLFPVILYEFQAVVLQASVVLLATLFSFFFFHWAAKSEFLALWCSWCWWPVCRWNEVGHKVLGHRKARFQDMSHSKGQGPMGPAMGAWGRGAEGPVSAQTLCCHLTAQWDQCLLLVFCLISVHFSNLLYQIEKLSEGRACVSSITIFLSCGNTK